MPQPRTYRTGTAVPTTPVVPEPPPASPVAPEPPSPPQPSVDLSDVWAAGMTADEALVNVLGPRPDRRTGDPEADCLAFMRELEDYARVLPLSRKLVLHALYTIYHPDNDDVWLRVARSVSRATGRNVPKSTAYSWAHPRVFQGQGESVIE